MASLLRTVMSIVVMAEFVLGNFANVFIALLNCADYIKDRKISLTDQILTALAVSRMAWLWVMLMNWSATVFHPDSYKRHERFVLLAWIITNHFATWLAAALSVFYLLKIPNFSNPVFLHLKQKVKTVLIAVLLMTSVLLLLNLIMAHICETAQVNVHGGNVTGATQLNNTAQLTFMMLSTLSNAIPLMVSLICLLLLIYSLCEHVGKMKRFHGEGSRDASTTVHVKAVCTVVSFLLLLLTHFLSLTISYWRSDKPSNEPLYLLCQAVGILYPSSHSYILIWGNQKLKQAFLLVMVKVRCRLKNGSFPLQ